MDFDMAMNFEERYFDQLQEGFNDLKKEVRANTDLTNKVYEQAKRTNGRVTKAEDDIKKLQRRSRFGINPNLLYLIALGLVLLLVIVATLLKINVGGLLG